MTQSLAWFNLIVGIAAILWETRLRVGALLSPFSVAMFMLVSIFAIRPLLVVDDPDHLFYGFQVSDGFSASALVGTIAILALACGYAIANLAEDRHASGRSRPARQAAPSASAFANEVGGASTTRLGLLAAAGLCLWALAMTAAGGASFLSAMVGGRSAEVSESLVNLPIVFYCLPAGVVFAAAFWRICREREFGALRGRDALVYWVTVAAGVVPPAFLGNRRFILPCVIAALLAAVLGGRRWSERVGLIRFAVGLVGFLAIATLPFVRSAGSRDPDSNLLGAMMTYVSDQGVTGVASNYFRSYDTEMFDYIALVSPDLGGDVPYGYGRGTLVDLVTSVVPARLLSTPPSWSDQILDTLFDATCGTGICPVPSIAGTAYFDFGFSRSCRDRARTGSIFLLPLQVAVSRSIGRQSSCRACARVLHDYFRPRQLSRASVDRGECDCDCCTGQLGSHNRPDWAAKHHSGFESYADHPARANGSFTAYPN